MRACVRACVRATHVMRLGVSEFIDISLVERVHASVYMCVRASLRAYVYFTTQTTAGGCKQDHEIEDNLMISAEYIFSFDYSDRNRIEDMDKHDVSIY